MKLRSLSIHGFKSFADATTIDFHEGITAVVGPNGCGKSNISDAIRWVLGEQRPSAIRGGKMEEAIFQGSLNRAPVNRAAVTMVVSNEDAGLPVSFEEVEIGRTVYRDGGSDYSLNRSTCRLRDVLDVCRGTGLGANAYSVIENRMIDAILSDRAEERRQLFEEASGIGKYKDRRKAAMRRLEHAERDLTRLEDVIGEVETKVRSLARQKGKAERYKTLRERRLAVEVSVVSHDLGALRDRLSDLDGALDGDRKTGQGMVAELRTAEARVETLRLEEVDAERSRSEAAGTLDGVRGRLVEWERDLAVAEERKGSAERRLGQIGGDREGSETRLREVAEELAALEARHGGGTEELERIREEATVQAGVVASVRDRLDEARDRLEEMEHHERDVIRKGAQLEGDADAAEAQAAELERRLQQIDADLKSASDVLTDLESQGDLFTGRMGGLESGVQQANVELESARGALADAKASLEVARGEELQAVRAAQGIEAEVTALEGLDRGQEGIDPVAKAVLALEDVGVVGPLLDFIEAPAELGPAVESYLGTLAKALVVKDSQAADRLVRWFSEDWAGGGGLILLPLDHVPDTAAGTLLESVRAIGEGAPWVEALLGEVDLIDEIGDESGTESPSARQRLLRDGTILDRRGLIRIGTPSLITGRLERKDRLVTLHAALSKAEDEASSCRKGLSTEEARYGAAEDALEKARAALIDAQDALRTASAEGAAQVDQRARIDAHRDELARQLEGTRAARARALERAATAMEDREGLLAQESGTREKRQAARSALDLVQDEWEAARGEEARLSIRLARAEEEAKQVAQRVEDLTRDRGVQEQRLADLDAEEQVLIGDVAAAVQCQEEGERETQRLFAERDAAQAVLNERSTLLTGVAEALAEAERTARTLRSAEREAVEGRHQLELERQEVLGGIGLIQERLEGEWGRPMDRLLEEAEPVDGTPEELKAELDNIVLQLERIGLVNMLAVEEHEEESTRLEFLSGQRDDLVAARDDLRAAIRKINETAIDLFEGTFEKIRENFRTTFTRLFEGGEADIWLTDSEDPLESPIEIHASPKGKKTQRIDLLSGGERALTALSLLFGIYLVKPSPFCVLDEVDAPLDENNIGRFIRLLQEFKEQTQFVLITHNPRSIEAADWIYGVTMEEPGVSTIVGVQLHEALQATGSAA
jgi:chromosome segregation protein